MNGIDQTIVISSVIYFYAAGYGYLLGKKEYGYLIALAVLFMLWSDIVIPRLQGTNAISIILATPYTNPGFWLVVILFTGLWLAVAYVFYKIGYKHYKQLLKARIDFATSMRELR